MKKFYLLICIVALASCKSKKVNSAPKVEKIETPAEVSDLQKSRAYELGKRVLNTCNTSKFKPFTTNEATEKVIQNTTLERLSSTCSKYLIKYGKFEDINLVEVIRRDDNSLVFRYKANYQRKFTQKELQVTLNEENKVSAIKSTDWSDIYIP